jgi:hypothetical protein
MANNMAFTRQPIVPLFSSLFILPCRNFEHFGFVLAIDLATRLG